MVSCLLALGLTFSFPLLFERFSVCLSCICRSVNVTVYHEMSHNVPVAIFMFLYFLKVNSMLFTIVKTIFKSED